MASKSVIAAVAAAGIAGAAVLLYIASIGILGPSQRAISDPIEGMETQSVENPAPPQHPAFPSAQNNLTAGNSSNDTR